ncbi:MAG TPA: hypothetical protein VIE44_13750 [Methylomirabilota bacterium]|jgi:hypothetical protein
MRRTLVLSIMMIGLLTVSLTGCGTATSSITGPTLLEAPGDPGE